MDHQYPALTQEELDRHYADQRLDAREFHKSLLKNLLGTGDLLRSIIEQRATIQVFALGRVSEPVTPQQSDLTVQYDRLAGAMRRTIILDEKLHEPDKPTRDRARRRSYTARAFLDATRARKPAKAQEADRPDPVERGERIERLDPPDAPADIAELPPLYAALEAEIGADPSVVPTPVQAPSPPKPRPARSFDCSALLPLDARGPRPPLPSG